MEHYSQEISLVLTMIDDNVDHVILFMRNATS